LRSVFEVIDESTLHVGPVYLTRWMRGVKGWRLWAWACVYVSIAFYTIWGVDSTWDQCKIYWDLLPQLFSGQMNLAQVHQASLVYYGVSSHWTAPIFYGLAFIILSNHLEGIGITKSYNFFMTTSLTLGNIGVFELAWNYLYSRLQNQPWTFSLQWRQGFNISCFSTFVFVGAMALLYLYADGYRVNVTPRKLAAAGIALGLWVLWVFYPAPVTQINVQTPWGPWTNGAMFPQTFYAVDIFDDGMSFGKAFYAPDYWVHFLNTACKAATVAALLNVGMVVKKK
jgi:hypothetical protein